MWQITGEVYDQIFIDGTYIAHGWCVISAATKDGVIAYQLCNRESKASYQTLLSRIPAPIVVATDGDRAALAAIKEWWPTTRIQRCLVHIQRNIRGMTTLNPTTEQHKALRQLGIDLTRIRMIDQAIAWQKKLAAFHDLYDPWLEEKTYRDHIPTHDIPAFARQNKQWWYTHYQTRRMIRSLDRYVKEGILFTYLRTDLDVHTTLASTTNLLEGGINSPLKTFLYAHRGWQEHRMLTAISYFLRPKPRPETTRIIHQQHQPPKSQSTRRTTTRTRRDRHRHQHPNPLGRRPPHPKRLGQKLTTRRHKQRVLTLNPNRLAPHDGASRLSSWKLFG